MGPLTMCPYIITTTSPAGFSHARHKADRIAEEVGGTVALTSLGFAVTRESSRAVATLEEARLAAHTAVESHRSDEYQHRAAMSRAVNRALKMPGQGGTITLPDGTVIEVERISWAFLDHRIRGTHRYLHREWDGPGTIDAYNAAQS